MKKRETVDMAVSRLASKIEMDDVTNAYKLAKAYKKHRDDAYDVLTDWREMSLEQLQQAVEVARVVLQGANPTEARRIVKKARDQ